MRNRLGAVLFLVALFGLATGIGCSKTEMPPPEIPKDGLKGITLKGAVAKPLPPIP